VPEVEIAGATLYYEMSDAGEPMMLIPGRSHRARLRRRPAPM